MIHHAGLQSLLARMTRRDVFRVSAAAGLSFLLPSLNVRAAQRRGTERPKSLITLWMAGGPSQLETWDPHSGAAHVGETAQAIKTSLSGLSISEFLPQTAEQMHNLALVRSLVSKEGDHERGTYYVQTGYRPDPTVTHPAMTAVVAKFLSDSGLEIPRHIVLADGGGFTTPRGGYLGAQFDAFRIYDPGASLHNLTARTNGTRRERRLSGLELMSQSFAQGRHWQAGQTLHEQVVDQALTMMSSEQLNAFSLDDEPAATRARYGDSRFGRGCLVARRLVEQGVRAIQVTLTGFDTHTNNLEGQQRQARILDPALATLVQDLIERDLWDSTIVLCIGEFGRTPWLNPAGGRDHWPVGFSCVLGGGGIPAGTVIGETDPDAAFTEKVKRPTDRKPPSDPVSVPDLYATILTVLGLDPSDMIATPIGRPIHLADGSPVKRLLPRS